MALLPKVKLKSLVTFPATVYGGAGIEVTKANGALTVNIDYRDFGEISSIPSSPTSYILTYDTLTQAYVMVPTQLLGGGSSGIADAPVNSTLYGRENAAWVNIPAGMADAPSDGTLYGRQNARWSTIPIPSGVYDYPTKAAVQAATVPAALNFLRIAGYNAPGDLGGALYKRVASPPAHNGKIQSADGAWWQIAERVLVVQMFGGAADNSTDNTAPLLSALGAGGDYPCVYFPKGIYSFNSQVSFATNPLSIMSLYGDGPDITELRWANNTNGIAITCGGSTQGFHFRDMAFTVSAVGGGSAIDINQTAGATNSSRFCNLVFRGSDAYQATFHWGTAIHLMRLSNVTFDQVFVSGPSAVAGNGVFFEGTAGAAPALFNFTDCVFNFLAAGITYGAYAQGVSVKGCNFTNNGSGIWVSAGSTGQDQLSVSSSQFGINNAGSGITVLGNLRDLNVSGNLFLFDNASGIYYDAGFLACIHGNNFSAGGTTNGIGINVQANAAEGGGPITGNTFYDIGTAVLLASGTSGWNVHGNTYQSTGTTVSNPGGAANQVGVATQ